MASFQVVVFGCCLVAVALLFVAQRRFQRKASGESSGNDFVDITKRIHFDRDWWTNPKRLDLECRAIFSDSWLLASHVTRLQKPGDYHAMTVGRYPIFVVRGKDNTIRAFHDVCRHRAYKITKKSAGSTLVFGCKYHGWSYDTNGSLVRAPEFETIPDFNKQTNSLFPISVQVSKHGFVFVNFAAAGSLAPFREDLLEKVASRYAISKDSKHVKDFDFSGAFNWKVAAKTSLRATGNSQSISLETHLIPSATIFSPVDRSYTVIVTYQPVSVNETSAHFDIYRSGKDVGRKIKVEADTLTKLETLARKHLKGLEELQALYSKSESTASLQEPLTNDFIAFQNNIESRTQAHARLEKVLGYSMDPAFIQSTLSPEGQEADMLCKQIEKHAGITVCGPGGNEELDW